MPGTGIHALSRYSDWQACVRVYVRESVREHVGVQNIRFVN